MQHTTSSEITYEGNVSRFYGVHLKRKLIDKLRKNPFNETVLLYSPGLCLILMHRSEYRFYTACNRYLILTI